MTSLWQDLAYSFRILARHRRFSLVAVLTLGLAIGAATALFSVIDAALLHPLPYAHPEQLVGITVEEPSDGRVAQFGPALAEVREWQRLSGVLAETCVYRSATLQIVDSGEFERVPVAAFTERCGALYGMPPFAGRDFDIDDTRIGARGAVLLGWDYWQRRFAGSTGVLGRTIAFADGPSTVIGIMPRGFQPGTSLFRALRARGPADVERRGRGTSTIARLRHGVTIAEAARVLSPLAVAGSTTPTRGVRLVSLYEQTTTRYRSLMRTLAGAVAMILLLACVNVAGLMLARGSARLPELAVRASLGASRARLLRQLLTESALLAFAAAALGLGFAWASLDVLVAIIPVSLPADAPARIDATVMAFTIAAAVVVAVAFGLAPALRLSRTSAGAVAIANRRHGSALSRRNGQALIAVEVALAVVLLAGAGVLIRSLARLVSTDLGFAREDVFAMEVVPAERKPEVLSMYYPELLRAIRRIGTVEHVGAADHVPLISGATMMNAAGDGAPEMFEVAQILPGYFQALAIPLLDGRLPTDADSRQPVAVLSRASAAKLFPGGTALGRRIVVNDGPREIVGIVGDVRHWGATSTLGRPRIYLPFGSTAAVPLTLVIKMRPGAALPADQLRQAAMAIGPRVFVERFRPGSEWLGTNTMRARHRTLLFTLFAGFGLLLALVGIFSMTAYAVANRTRELGVRVALGARADQVVGAVLKDAVWPIALGLAVGLCAAAAATRLVASFLFNTTPTDPSTFAMVAVVLLATGCVAAWIPARHVARIDPVLALRSE